MPYTVESPPEWLKDLPEGAVKIGVERFNAVLADTDPSMPQGEREEKARIACWVAIKEQYEKGDDEPWRAKQDVLLVDDEIFTLLVRMAKASDPEGAAFEVIIAEPGFTKNGWYFPEDVLRDAADLFNGVDVNLYELPDRGATHIPDQLFDLKSLLVRNKCGWLDGVRYVAGEGLKGILHFVESFRWLGKNILRAMQEGVKVYGLSLDAPTKAAKAVVDGRNVIKALKLVAVDSVDIVSRPAAGGKFNRAVAAQDGGQKIMNREELLGIISSKRPDLLQGKDLVKITDDEVKTLARMAMEPAKVESKPDEKKDEDLAAVKARMDQLECGRVLDSTLSTSGLPDYAQAKIRTQFETKVFAKDDLTRSVQAEKDYLAAIDAAHAAAAGSMVPGTHVRVGIGSYQKAQMALDRLFGLTQEDMVGFARMSTLDGQPFFEDRDFRGQPVLRSAQDFNDYANVPQFRGIREAYAFFTGDPDVRGFMNRQNLPPELRASMDFLSSTFTYVLGNTMARRLVRTYRQMDFKIGLLVSIKKPVKDFRQQEAVLVGGFPDIETVDPEAANYNEISTVTDEESTYTIGQKGNLLSISRKTVINDDLQIILRLLDGFARSFARTHGKYVWNFFISNSTCSDATAWFTAGHGNLGTTALTHATALVAYTALSKMAEKDSGERIGLIDGSFKLNLVGPVDIMNLMTRIEQEDFYYTANDVSTKIPNPLYGKVTANVIPLLTDTNDWGMLLPPNQIDMIEMGYLNGREEPEFFVADTPQSEQVFVRDKIRHKGRHEYAGVPIDYRSGYKAVVA